MPTVLVVDDLATDRCLVAGLLASETELHIDQAVDGQEAFERIRQSRPDLVITDLMMPEMNGLELVTAVRANYPMVPVILMTSLGSEEVAVQALQRGAASYVPKRLLNRYLVSTVRNLLAMTSQQKNRTRLLGCMTGSEYHFSLENDSALIPALVSYLQESAAHMGLFDDTDRLRVAVALEEALVNAMFHGNLEVSSELRAGDERDYRDLIERRRKERPFCERRIYLQARMSDSEAQFIVRDEGPGFDVTQLPDPTDPANLERASGRGVLLMRTFMNEVNYNGRGNEVTMIRRYLANGKQGRR
jgi:CheY-like chemotaxis protein